MRVACWQPGVDGVRVGHAWTEVLEACARRRIDLLVTPEFAIGGLPHTVERARAAAVADPADLVAYAAGAPRDLTLVLGFTESDTLSLYSSAAVLRAEELVTVARKLHPREPGITPGRGSAVFEIGQWRCGVVICADAARPEASAFLATRGAHALICPLNNDMSEATASRWEQRTDDELAARARETACWVVSADVAGTAPGRRALAATRVYGPDGRHR